MMSAGCNEEVLRESFMTKRSQNKKKSWPTNWRDRWFVLTPKHIIYYDGDKTVSISVNISFNLLTFSHYKSYYLFYSKNTFYFNIIYKEFKCLFTTKVM